MPSGSQTNPSYGLYTIDSTHCEQQPSHDAYSDVHFNERSDDARADVYVPVLPDVSHAPSVRADVQTGRHNTDCK